VCYARLCNNIFCVIELGKLKLSVDGHNSRIAARAWETGTYSLGNLLETPRGRFAADEHASYYREAGIDIEKQVRVDSHKV
jgi:hypothetical protein